MTRVSCMKWRIIEFLKKYYGFMEHFYEYFFFLAGGDDVLRAKVDRLRTLLRQRRRPYGRREYGPAVAWLDVLKATSWAWKKEKLDWTDEEDMPPHWSRGQVFVVLESSCCLILQPSLLKVRRYSLLCSSSARILQPVRGSIPGVVLVFWQYGSKLRGCSGVFLYGLDPEMSPIAH